MQFSDLQKLGHFGDDVLEIRHHGTASPSLTVALSEPDSCFSSRRSLFEHGCDFESPLSVDLYLDDRGEIEPILDLAGSGGDEPTDAEGHSLESWHGLVSEDMV